MVVGNNEADCCRRLGVNGRWVWEKMFRGIPSSVSILTEWKSDYL